MAFNDGYMIGFAIAFIIIAIASWHMAVNRERNKWLALVSTLVFGAATLAYYGVAGHRDSGKAWYGILAGFGVFVGMQILAKLLF